MFNVYYINYAKAFEIAMQMDNKVLEQTIKEHGWEAGGNAGASVDDKDEVIYVIDAAPLANGMRKQNKIYEAFWRGMTKSLVSAQWFLWEENSPEGKVRFKIAKKTDKFC